MTVTEVTYRTVSQHTVTHCTAYRINHALCGQYHYRESTDSVQVSADRSCMKKVMIMCFMSGLRTTAAAKTQYQ